MIVTFSSLPTTLAEFESMPEYNLKTPFQTAALFIVAICAYPSDPKLCYDMIDSLKGPVKLDQIAKNFIKDRMRDKGEYLGKAYFKGAAPENNYTPSQPYSVELSENPHSYDQEGYAKVFITTGGADSPRPVTLRKKGDDWFLWEYSSILLGIKTPKSADPWA